MRILLGVHYRKPSIAGHVKGGTGGSLKLSSLGAGLSLGLCGIVSLSPCRSTCYPSSPCPLSLEPVLPEPHPRATISGCQDSKGKSQQKSEGREQREAKVFIPLAALQDHRVGCVPHFEAMFLSRWLSPCRFWKLLPPISLWT